MVTKLQTVFSAGLLHPPPHVCRRDEEVQDRLLGSPLKGRGLLDVIPQYVSHWLRLWFSSLILVLQHINWGLQGSTPQRRYSILTGRPLGRRASAPFGPRQSITLGTW